MAFGDIRVAERADWLIERMVALGTVALRRIGATRSGEMAVHRFLSSPYVSTENIVDTSATRTVAQCRGRRILAVQDTSEINFSGRDRKRRGFGPAGNGKTPGFFIHPVIAVDVETEAVVGLVDATIWTRRLGKSSPRRDRPFEDKESARWLSGCTTAALRLDEAAAVTMVADRESDIYPLFARRPAELDLIVRVAQNRSLANGDRLFEALGEAPRLATRQVKVAPRGPGDKGRIAEIELRSTVVSIARPRNGCDQALPETIAMTFLEAREVARRQAKQPCCGGCSPPMPSIPLPMPNRSSISIACVGVSSSCSARSRATDWLWKTAKSSMPSDCSISPHSLSSPPSEPCSWSTPEMAARDRPVMSLTTTSLSRSNGCRANSKARPPSRKILTRLDRLPSSPGSQHGSAGGIATMESQDQRPCASAGPNWQRLLPVTPLLLRAKSVNPVALRERVDRAER